LGSATLAVALTRGGYILETILDKRGSDALRLTLIADGFSSALLSGGFGRGLGAEKAMIDSGEIPLNFHNVFAQLAAELGLVVSAAFLTYLFALVLGWAFVTRSARAIGREAALARATLAAALLIYGVTSSGVLESPVYWAFLAANALLTAVGEVPDSQHQVHSGTTGGRKRAHPHHPYRGLSPSAGAAWVHLRAAPS